MVCCRARAEMCAEQARMKEEYAARKQAAALNKARAQGDLFGVYNTLRNGLSNIYYVSGFLFISHFAYLYIQLPSLSLYVDIYYVHIHGCYVL